MSDKKKKSPDKSLTNFLKTNYQYTDLRYFSTSSSFSNTLNAIYLAKNASGKDIFIKACPYADMCENEYKHGLALWEKAPDNFARPLAYHAGRKFSFCSNEYLAGQSFEELFKQKTVFTPEQKAQIIEDIYTIHLALRDTGITHRDIEWKNLLYHNGRVILIDCQLAISKNARQDIFYYRDITRVCKMRKRQPLNMSILEWDDTVHLLNFVQSIGCEPEFKERFDFICSELTAAVGKYKYVYPYPGIKELNSFMKVFRFKSLFHPKSKRRENSRIIHSMLQYLRNNHPSLKN